MEKKTATVKGIKKCSQWLSYCLSIGFKKEDLDALEKLWWKHRDENGNLITKP